jgi:hypothetical protein
MSRPPAPINPRSRPGHSPAIAQRNAAAARAAAQPPLAPAVPGSLPSYAAARAAAAGAATPPPALAVPGGIPNYDKLSFGQKRLEQDKAARRDGR